MLISYEDPKLIFIHIQKTGGVSISDLLGRFVSTTIQDRSCRHMSARRALKQVENPGDYFKFAFVRNPWDRLVSWYAMIDQARRKVADGTAGPKARRPIKKNNLFKYVLRCGPTFDEFVKNCTEKQWVANCYYSFTFNQLRYLTDKNGEMLVSGLYRAFRELHARPLARLRHVRHRRSPARYTAQEQERTQPLLRDVYTRD